MNSPALKSLVTEEVRPGLAVQTDEQLLDEARNVGERCCILHARWMYVAFVLHACHMHAVCVYVSASITQPVLARWGLEGWTMSSMLD